jgi:hypothetical protein
MKKKNNLNFFNHFMALELIALPFFKMLLMSIQLKKCGAPQVLGKWVRFHSSLT